MKANILQTHRKFSIDSALIFFLLFLYYLDFLGTTSSCSMSYALYFKTTSCITISFKLMHSILEGSLLRLRMLIEQGTDLRV